MYPAEECCENDGTGWAARVLSVSRGYAKVQAAGFRADDFQVSIVLQWQPLPPTKGQRLGR